MAQSLVIIDYGSGNLKSAEKAFLKANTTLGLAFDITVSNDPEQIRKADRLVLPGVGAFGQCANGIKAIDGLWQVIEDSVTHRAVPFLGICVGMQLMAERGLEHGIHAGFGWIKADVVALQPSGSKTEKGHPTSSDLKIPHMGWNSLTPVIDHNILDGLSQGSDVYFVHSYHMISPKQEDIPLLATTDYGGPVTALIGRDNMIGCQFHPEKSQAAGLTLIGNFLRWSP